MLGTSPGLSPLMGILEHPQDGALAHIRFLRSHQGMVFSEDLFSSLVSRNTGRLCPENLQGFSLLRKDLSCAIDFIRLRGLLK